MATPNVPDKPSLEGLEARWGATWDEQGTYAFDRTKERAEVFSIDDPARRLAADRALSLWRAEDQFETRYRLLGALAAALGAAPARAEEVVVETVTPADLLIVAATPEERAAHDAYLDGLSKATKGICLWKELEPVEASGGSS